MAESYNGYCVKCKDKRDFDGDIAETNGRRMAKGTCPVCGTRMNRIPGQSLTSLPGVAGRRRPGTRRRPYVARNGQRPPEDDVAFHRDDCRPSR